jgi:hypothetical protein
VFLNAFLTMKADQSADCAGRWVRRQVVRPPPHRAVLFFSLGPRNSKMDLKKLGFRLGSDLAMLSTCTGIFNGHLF